MSLVSQDDAREYIIKTDVLRETIECGGSSGVSIHSFSLVYARKQERDHTDKSVLKFTHTHTHHMSRRESVCVCM